MAVKEVASRFTTGADAPYWNALAAGQLQLPRCTHCGLWHWPAVFRCGECGSWEHQWQSLPMRGRVFSYARNWHPFAGTEGIGVPYVSLIVELPQAGGRRVLGLYKGDEQGLKIGASVRGEPAVTIMGDDRIPAMHWVLDMKGDAEAGA